MLATHIVFKNLSKTKMCKLNQVNATSSSVSKVVPQGQSNVSRFVLLPVPKGI